MKDAINYFIPIVKDPMNDITGRCITNHGLDSAYCGTYHQNVALRNANTHQPSNDTGLHYPDVQMETNSMEIQYNNLIEIDDYQECQQRQQREIPQQPTRKRNNLCENESSACAKRCRVENADPSIFLPSDQSTPPIIKSQSHQRQPTHNMPDMPRCMMGHYV